MPNQISNELLYIGINLSVRRGHRNGIAEYGEIEAYATQLLDYVVSYRKYSIRLRSPYFLQTNPTESEEVDIQFFGIKYNIEQIVVIATKSMRTE